MIKTLLSFVIGSIRITVKGTCRTSAVDLMMKYSMSPYKIKVSENGDYEFRIAYTSLRALRRCFDEYIIEYTVSDLRGLPAVLVFFRRRFGFALGIVFFLVIGYYSSRTVWNIDITGNERLSDEAVLNILDRGGFGYGTYIPSVDFDDLQARVIAYEDDVSWISVNMRGNTAYVELRETRFGEREKHEEGVYANLVASEDAVVYLTEAEIGLPSVENGTTVRRGELLVSGVIPLREGGVRFVYASGRVMAYVTREFEVALPFRQAKKEYTGRITVEKNVKIFKKNINLSINSGIEYTTYDKIEESERFYLFGKIPMPVWWEKTVYKEYGYSDHYTSYEDTVSEAMAELRFRTDEVLLDAELVSMETSYDITDEALVVKRKMICLKDISEVSEFTARNTADERISE